MSCIKQKLDRSKIKSLSRLIARCNKVVITCHIAPDGDAIGSSLALCNMLTDLGKEVHVVTPDMFQANLNVLPGARDIVVYSRYEAFAQQLIGEADLIFCLDYNSIKRIDRVGSHVLQSKASKVMIDHHLDPEDFADIIISHPEESSTSVLLFRVFCALGLVPLISKEIGSCIYTGMMTDTGNFSYNSNDSELYPVIAKLVECGVDKDKLYSQIVNTSTLSSLRINGYAVSEKMTLYPESRAALITLTRDELNRFEYQKGDTESLVNVPLKLKDISCSFFLREEAEYIKVSSRSKGNLPVNKLCETYFNGGGHMNAAGGEFYGTMEECVARFESMLKESRDLILSSK
ncbi:MAG: DHH family phosphoesterase [Clostridiales bacterium]|nr:DHH family phosphoesterase [Clostridiales bacterium]